MTANPRAQRPASVGVDRAIRVIAEGLTERIDELIETMLGRMREEVPELVLRKRPDLEEAVRRSSYGNVRTALAALGTDRRPPAASPAEASETTRTTAQAGVSLAALLHTYRIGHAVVWEGVLDEVRKHELRGPALDAVLRIVSRYLFAYIDAVLPIVADEYMAERDRTVRSRAQRRMQLVRDVLDGGWVEAAELGYDLDAEHVAVVAVGPLPEAELRAIASFAGRSLLALSVGEQTAWGWLGSRKPMSAADWRSLTAHWSAPRCELAFGEPASGAPGFRLTHGQAQSARAVATRLKRRFVRYDDVALEALALADEAAARDLVQRELGSLAGDDDRAMRLRHTLQVYLEAGMNAAAAASVLAVSDRTVAYRIRSIEDMLGRSVLRRGAELTVALRARALGIVPEAH